MPNTHFLLPLQLPTGTPGLGEHSSIDVSQPFDIIVYIIAPILIVALYFYWKKTKNADKD